MTYDPTLDGLLDLLAQAVVAKFDRTPFEGISVKAPASPDGEVTRSEEVAGREAS